MDVRKKFTLRIDIDDLLEHKSVLDLLVNYIELYIIENRIKIEIHILSDCSDVDTKITDFKLKFKNLKNIIIKKYNFNLNTYSWFSIINKKQLNKIENYRFVSSYENESEMIVSIFEFFSFIKAATNRGDSKDGSRDIRKQNVRKKGRHKTIVVGSKK